ncbi:Uncharacterised protein [Vibrio cholerae]|nr:Uncharacterised protein [Vibrio cholerae]
MPCSSNSLITCWLRSCAKKACKWLATTTPTSGTSINCSKLAC